FESTEKFIREQERYEKALLQKEKEAETVGDKSKTKGIRYKMVTVLFSNVVGFSKLTEQDNAEKLIDDLDKFYFHFDNTVKSHNIKKIRTIGDTYICAGGIPKKNRTNPIEVVLAAFEMQQYMNHLKSKYPLDKQKIWGIRIGIHTGPVFAQFENIKSPKYEIWGETVNIANRVEAIGDFGRVNISSSTYELVRDYFLCQYFGKLPVKYRGDIDLYVIEGFRPLLSVENKGLVPNNAFKVKLAFIRFDDLEEEILDKLERELPKDLYYHNIKHTIDVVNQVEIIGRREDITDEEMLLLKTAALFHDIGFTVGYKDHELLGIQIAKEILPKFNYTDEQISKICDLIFATRLPPNPTNKLEEIICDADLDYLGRADFIPVSNMLFKELVEHGAIEYDINQWNQKQLEFISNHQYFTKTAKELRDVNKNKQLENIRNQLEKQS
ncbi:MAG TPA: adenylate/guanylate cyclase domain-containing protein, partial [Salinivirgaceae bacterium]|nr:adenylate/guanylate cyclase domain-containing protein [Salinivirgaceae bacterium]